MVVWVVVDHVVVMVVHLPVASLSTNLPGGSIRGLRAPPSWNCMASAVGIVVGIEVVDVLHVVVALVL